MPAFRTHLMFEGNAEAAMTLYLSLFPGSIQQVTRYGPGEPGKEGSIKRADFALGQQQMTCIDSYVHHAFTFTPAVSIYVDCDSEAELEQRFAELARDGQVLMELADYGFSRRFGWLNDRFGVSWQLNLP